LLSRPSRVRQPKRRAGHGPSEPLLRPGYPGRPPPRCSAALGGGVSRAPARKARAERPVGSLPRPACPQARRARTLLALRQERDRGDWPACFDELWSAIETRCGPPRGRQEAPRQMVDVLVHPFELKHVVDRLPPCEKTSR
jgi:hypothetical protein